MNHTPDTAPPPEVQRLIDRGREAVTEAFGVQPDMTPETLPLADGFLREVAASAHPSHRERLLTAIGCYFGEVVRRKLDARWAVDGSDPHQWRIELRSCFLYFSPVGMAGEVMFGCETPEHDGSFGTHDDTHDDLAQMLAAAAPYSEDEYYSLSGRVDVLELVSDWLVARRLVQARGHRPEPLTAEDYQRELGEA